MLHHQRYSQKMKGNGPGGWGLISVSIIPNMCRDNSLIICFVKRVIGALVKNPELILHIKTTLADAQTGMVH